MVNDHHTYRAVYYIKYRSIFVENSGLIDKLLPCREVDGFSTLFFCGWNGWNKHSHFLSDGKMNNTNTKISFFPGMDGIQIIPRWASNVYFNCASVEVSGPVSDRSRFAVDLIVAAMKASVHEMGPRVTDHDLDHLDHPNFNRSSSRSSGSPQPYPQFI